MRTLCRMARRMAGLDEDPDDDEYDPVAMIVDGAFELGVTLTPEEVVAALKEVGLEADEVLTNQPVLPNPGPSLAPGTYVFYKGGDVDPDQPGFVTDDPGHASNWGFVHEVVVECTGASRSAWTFVHDWDGFLQLVMPGPECSKATDEAWLILKPAESVRPV
jgi:hypothetical protein